MLLFFFFFKHAREVIKKVKHLPEGGHMRSDEERKIQQEADNV